MSYHVIKEIKDEQDRLIHLNTSHSVTNYSYDGDNITVVNKSKLIFDEIVGEVGHKRKHKFSFTFIEKYIGELSEGRLVSLTVKQRYRELIPHKVLTWHRWTRNRNGGVISYEDSKGNWWGDKLPFNNPFTVGDILDELNDRLFDGGRVFDWKKPREWEYIP
jgi:hypothetical protein